MFWQFFDPPSTIVVLSGGGCIRTTEGSRKCVGRCQGCRGWGKERGYSKPLGSWGVVECRIRPGSFIGWRAQQVLLPERQRRWLIEGRVSWVRGHVSSRAWSLPLLTSVFYPLHPAIVLVASPRARGATEHDTMFTTLPPPPRAAETQNILSFEGSAEEVLRYTIVAKVRCSR